MINGRDREDEEPPDSTHRLPPNAPGSRVPPRRGAPAGPPPPPDSFRPAGPPPPPDSFRPGRPMQPPAAPAGGRDRSVPAGRPRPDEPPGRGAGEGGGSGSPPQRPGAGKPGAARPREREARDAPPTASPYAPPPTASPYAPRPAPQAPPPPAPQPYGGGTSGGLEPVAARSRPSAADPFGQASAPPPGSAPIPTREAPPPTGVRTKKNKKKRWPKVTAIVLAFLLVLFVIGDRVAVRVAADQMQKRVEIAIVEQSEPGTAPPTVRDVSLGGFPFLTQVLFGNYRDIRFTIEGLTTPGPRIQEARARLQGVHVPLGDAISDNVKAVPVDEVQGTVVVTYADLNAFLAEETKDGAFRNVQVNPIGNGERVEATATVGLSDVDLGPVTLPGLGDQSVRGVAEFSVTDGVLSLSLNEIGVEGTFDASIPLPPFDAITIRTPTLPFDLRIVEAETNATGLSLTAKANDVTLPAG